MGEVIRAQVIFAIILALVFNLFKMTECLSSNHLSATLGNRFVALFDWALHAESFLEHPLLEAPADGD